MQPALTRRPLRRRRSRAGMTLVEIVVVIALIGTLMSVIAVGVARALDQGNVDTTKLQMKRLDQELTMYAARHKGKYPSTSDGLEALGLDEGQLADAWGNAFQYTSPGSNSQAPYEIVSLGKDGTEGGDGFGADIKSWEIE